MSKHTPPPKSAPPSAPRTPHVPSTHGQGNYLVERELDEQSKARETDATTPTAPIAPAQTVGDAGGGQVDQELKQNALARETEARPVTDSLAKSDLPPTSPAAKKREGELLAKQAGADADTVLIHNTTAQLFTVALFSPVDPKKPGASSKAFRLLPGVNQLPRAQWEKAKGEKMVQLHVTEGLFVELGAKSLAELDEKRALELVDLTVDDRLLKTWHGSEQRSKVRAALEAQGKKVATTKPADDKDEDKE